MKTIFMIAVTLSMLHQAAGQVAAPQISSVYAAGPDIVVTVEVPGGLRRVTLESRTQLSTGAWEPRAVQRLDGTGGQATFTLPANAHVQLLRVRASEHDPLPESFYRGSNTFENRVRLAQNLDASAAPTTDPSLTPLYSSPGGSVAPPPLAVREVSESDIWKLRGDTLYYFNHYRGLQVIDVSDADAPAIRG